MKPINAGLLGIGTVGGGTYTVLKRNAEEITRRAAVPSRSVWWPIATWSWHKASPRARRA